MLACEQVRFPFEKKCRKIAIGIGISVWEERVSFVASSIRGSRGRSGCLKDRERYGTGDKEEEIFKWNTNFPF